MITIVSSGLGLLIFGVRAPSSSPVPYNIVYLYATLVFLAGAVIGGYLNVRDPKNCVTCGNIHEAHRLWARGVAEDDATV